MTISLISGRAMTQPIACTDAEQPKELPSNSAACSQDFMVRLVVSVQFKDHKWLEDAWRDVNLSMPPFVGMLMNLDEERGMQEVESIQWVEKTNRIHVRLQNVNVTQCANCTEQMWFDDGWKKWQDGLWS